MKLSFECFDTLTDELITIKSENWETSAYIKSTMKKYIRSDKDLSKQSVVLLWFDAKHSASFEKFQDIGDWVFFTSVLFPKTISCDMNFYQSIGRSSYYKCHRHLHGSWPLYEELADNFTNFVRQLQNSGFRLR